MKASLPSIPPQKVSADIPIMMWVGLHVSTSRTDRGIVSRISLRKCTKLSSLDRSVCSTKKRPGCQVTPRSPARTSRWRSYSTAVLVEGMITPTLARCPM
jgi:hypothetical protein